MNDRLNLGTPYQIGIVVNDLQASLRAYWYKYGIGPWSIHTFDRSSVTDMWLNGAAADFVFKIGLTMWGPFQLELIQPISGNSIYWSHLKERGDGLHHVCHSVDDVGATTDRLAEAGIQVLQSGTFWRSGKFAYLDTKNDLGFLLEIAQRPRQEDRPPAEAVYPAAEGRSDA